MAQLVVFLDDGGVINDSRERTLQWYPLVAEFFVPKLGGTAEAWAEANRRLFPPPLPGVANPQTRLRLASLYSSYDRRQKIEWLRAMCELVGVPSPPDEECLALSRAAYRHITRNVHSALPGAVDGIRTLSRQGYVLHTASGESSEELDGYLEGTGVWECFDRLYGPDLVGTFKDGPRFYERILEDSGVAARDALVVDDSPLAVGWAREAGVKAVLIDATSPPSGGATLCLGSLGELPMLIDSLGGPKSGGR